MQDTVPNTSPAHIGLLNFGPLHLSTGQQDSKSGVLALCLRVPNATVPTCCANKTTFSSFASHFSHSGCSLNKRVLHKALFGHWCGWESTPAVSMPFITFFNGFCNFTLFASCFANTCNEVYYYAINRFHKQFAKEI